MKTKTCQSTKRPVESTTPAYLRATCDHCGGEFQRGYNGPRPKYGGVSCRVAAHRAGGKAAATKALKGKLRAKARR